MKRAVVDKKPSPANIKQATPAIRDSRGFVPSPFGGRVRRIRPVD